MLKCLSLPELFQSLNESQNQLPSNLANEILDMEKTHTGNTEERKKFKSVEEIKKYLKQETDSWHSEQLTRIQSEHNYASSSLTNVTPDGHNELSDEGYVSPCEENAVTFESNPSSKIYNLRGIEKFKKEENCICCK